MALFKGTYTLIHPLCNVSSVVQAVEDILSSTSKMLESQIPATTPPCIVGQYYPSSSWDKGYEGRKGSNKEGLNGTSDCVAPITSTKENNCNGCGHVNGFKQSPVWVTAVSWKVEGGGYVPRLFYLRVKGVQYYADTHVSGISHI